MVTNNNDFSEVKPYWSTAYSYLSIRHFEDVTLRARSEYFEGLLKKSTASNILVFLFCLNRCNVYNSTLLILLLYAAMCRSVSC